jgi:hypothetical protein
MITPNQFNGPAEKPAAQIVLGVIPKKFLMTLQSA